MKNLSSPTVTRTITPKLLTAAPCGGRLTVRISEREQKPQTTEHKDRDGYKSSDKDRDRNHDRDRDRSRKSDN